ncbi:TPA: DUF1566 domain-containing protein [Legionella pneumophila]|nr:DUF1566 domain-containing protein [Legionella pneumophila]HAT1869164.1 DUF1566 domain-containing protein [Legionella pneumophila]HAU0554813.1 DUF1566 domain-containing protein [Legionella pneumophila]HAU2274168.1 DUF1566 domain-containing protein [Legionella pneumophila]HDO7891256.1 DUF1566 domain-containing protein [Legionella pneumophila]
MHKTLSIISAILATCICSPILAHEIGEYYQGGIIYWVDKSEIVERGLIAAPSDQARNVKWANREYATGAILDGIYAGKVNTKKITDALGPYGNYAAKIASSYKDGTYSDWYLPSIYELNLMFNQRNIIGEFNSDPLSCEKYWSSTEAKAGKAWSQSFSTGDIDNDKACGLDSSSGNVRAIRSYQEVFTTFECSIVSGISNGGATCSKWNNYRTGYVQGCGAFSSNNVQPIYECTVRNGSILVSSSEFFIDPKTNRPFKDILLTNETKYFYGKQTKVSSLVSIGATFIVPK